MRNRRFGARLALVATLILAQALVSPSFGPREACGQSLESAGSEEGFGDLLLSGRMEIIHFHNFTGRIRAESREKSRFYFNNIFLNLEGSLDERTDSIIEYQPLTSDLYLLGGGSN